MNTDRIYYSHDAEVQALQDRNLLIVLYMALGLGIGAILALLFAPTSGKTTRQNLAKGVEQGLQTGREAVEPIVKRVEQELQTGREAVEPIVKRVEQGLQTGREAVEPIVKRVEQGLQAGRDALEPVTKRAEKELHELQKNVEDRLK